MEPINNIHNQIKIPITQRQKITFYIVHLYIENK